MPWLRLDSFKRSERGRIDATFVLKPVSHGYSVFGPIQGSDSSRAGGRRERDRGREACRVKKNTRKIYFMHVGDKKNRYYASLYNLTYTISPLCLSLFIYAIIYTPEGFCFCYYLRPRGEP